MTTIGPVWVTKYALTTGIIYVPDADYNGDNMVSWGGSWSNYAAGEGREWHRSEEAAQLRAKAMAAAKIASLDKQRRKLAVIAEKGAKVVA